MYGIKELEARYRIRLANEPVIKALLERAKYPDAESHEVMRRNAMRAAGDMRAEEYQQGWLQIAELIGEMSIGAGLPSLVRIMIQTSPDKEPEPLAIPGRNLEAVFEAIYRKLKTSPEYYPLKLEQEKNSKLFRAMDEVAQILENAPHEDVFFDHVEGRKIVKFTDEARKLLVKKLTDALQP